MVKKQLFATLVISFSMNAFGADFSDADAKFSKRDANLATTLAARDAYKAILDQGAKDVDLVRAGEGYLRTFIYEGTHYKSTKDSDSKKARKAVFNACWKTAAEILSPAALGFESPVYYYFRASCMAYEAEVSTVLERLALLPKLNSSVDKGITTQGGTSFEGGGILRVKAAVKGNPEAKGLPGGLYNPQEASKLIEQALASEAYPGNAEGALFCENFRRKVGILAELGSKSDALVLADKTLTDFQSYLDDGLIPEFIRAETADCLLTVAELKATIGASAQN